MPRVFNRMDTTPPPFLTVAGGTTAVTLPQTTNDVGDEPSSSSASSSIIIVIIIIASAIIVSASVYLLLRCFSRRCHRSLRQSSAADDVVSSTNQNAQRRDRCIYERQSSADDLMSSLPVFTFGSVTGGNIVGGDCAVCLSKFETNDQLRLLPLCCHAFHTQCIDAWVLSNQTCPLCRSTVNPTETDVLNKIMSSTAAENGGNSFRIEIGSISRRRDSGVDGRRSYSVGSFEYVVDDGYEIPVGSTHRREVSDCTSVDKESTGVPPPPGESLAGEVAGGRSWLRDYVDRMASASSRTLSFRSSGRFFTGSSRRSDAVVGGEDLEANRIGEEISELFRWLSGV